MQPHLPNQTQLPTEPGALALDPEIKKLINKTVISNRITLSIPFLFLFLTVISANILPGLFLLFLFLTIISGMLVAIRIFAKSDKFKLKYRQTVVDRILRNVFNQLTYEPDSYLSVQEFYASGLTEKYPNLYEADNYIQLKRPNYTMELCYVYAVRQTSRTSNNNQYTSSSLMHMGLFLKFSLPVQFPEDIIILKDKGHSIWYAFDEGPQNIFIDFNRVTIDDPAFEKEFQVYAKSKEKTLQFLDKSILEFLMDLRNKLGDHVQISFLDDAIYMSLYAEKDVFKPGFILSKNGRFFKRSLEEAQRLNKIAEMLHPFIEKQIKKYNVN